MGVTHYIHGPIVSSSDIGAHRDLFGAFGMVEAARRALTEAECAAEWGVPDRRAVEVTMETPGTRFGVRVVGFDPASPTVIRHRESGFDADALKVIDFYAPDFDQARSSVEAAGWALDGKIAEYSLPEGDFREGHVWGPDGVVCALLAGPAEFFSRFATITDRLFSEPQSISGPTSNRAAAVGFFETVFDLETVSRYGIVDDSFRELVGSKAKQFSLSAINMGLRTEEPYFGLIDYGMPAGSFQSLSARSRLPNLGLVGATIVVSDAAAIESRAVQGGFEILAPLKELDLPGFGPALCCLVRGPNGGAYHAVQRLA